MSTMARDLKLHRASRVVGALVALLCLGATPVAMAAAGPTDISRQPRIINGVPATDDFSFVVALLSSTVRGPSTRSSAAER